MNQKNTNEKEYSTKSWTGCESIGYFLIVEFKDTETTILHQILSVIRGYTKMEEYKLDLPNETIFPGLFILPDQRRILVEGNEIYLTHHEFDMMLFLARHPGQVFTREQLYEAVWDDIPISVYAKVECMIYSIRKKLRAYTDRQYIQTVWGVGYTFDPGT